MSATPTDIVIRPLVKDDAAQWRRLRLEALQTYPTAFASSYEEALQQDLATRIPSEGPDALFGAFHGDILSGSAGLYVQAPLKQRHKGQLWGVYVDPSLHRRGVGVALVGAVIAHARTRVAVLQLSVQLENAAARALYRRLGFVCYGIERRALRYQGRDYDDELMALDLIARDT
jgi:ribosomal protein S18 acetylase RimI-like enzyme